MSVAATFVLSNTLAAALRPAIVARASGCDVSVGLIVATSAPVALARGTVAIAVVSRDDSES